MAKLSFALRRFFYSSDIGDCASHDQSSNVDGKSGVQFRLREQTINSMATDGSSRVISAEGENNSTPEETSAPGHTSNASVSSASRSIHSQFSFGLSPPIRRPEGRNNQSNVSGVSEGGAPEHEEHVTQSEKRQNGRMRKKRVIGVSIASLLLLSGIAVGSGVGVSQSNRHEGGSDMQTSGASPYSGAVVIDLESFINDKTRITGYFHRFDGIIELSEYYNNSWHPGPNSGDLNTTTSNFNGQTLTARADSPLMALEYVNQAGELIWHVVYVTVDNYLSEWYNSNITNAWSQGTLRAGNYSVSNSSSTGCSACVNRHWYGAPFNETGLGIRVYYGTPEGHIQELGFNVGGPTTWFKGHTFINGKGEAGFECTVRGSSITYLWMQNKQGQLLQMWRDFNMSAKTEKHAVGEWVSGLIYSDILPNSAITAISDFESAPPTKHVIFQAPDLSIVELISNGSAENDAWGGSVIVGGPENGIKGVNGTRIGSVILNTGIGGAQELHVLFQTNLTNMVDFIRSIMALNWSLKVVPVGL